MDHDRLLTLDEVCTILNISRNRLYKLTSARKISIQKHGDEIRVRLGDIIE